MGPVAYAWDMLQSVSPSSFASTRAGDVASIASVDGGTKRPCCLNKVAPGRGYAIYAASRRTSPFALSAFLKSTTSVDLAHRKQGTATALIRAFEDLAKTEGAIWNLVRRRVCPDYGDAQRLYWRLAYRPMGEDSPTAAGGSRRANRRIGDEPNLRLDQICQHLNCANRIEKYMTHDAT